MNNEDSALSHEALVARVANLEKQASETARRLAERNAMLESAGDAIYGIDAHGLCIFINRATAKLLGYSEQECLGHNMHELIHHTRPDGRPYPADECPIYVNSQSGLGVKVDDEIVWRKDGTAVPVEYAARPIYLDGGIHGSVITMRDITDRKRTEAALRDSEEQFRMLADSIPQLVWMADADRLDLLVQPALVRIHRNHRRGHGRLGLAIRPRSGGASRVMECWRASIADRRSRSTWSFRCGAPTAFFARS